ncbi:uncharacterized protein LOC121760628 [Salvia splendens]|uniref:uncharacterized protein LOC121760628 n=1 Tax=Salvia splendens TaxID=180675 RepID=UPI001C27737F|nr:uncharacterized protein LOC121760628 [Salvia splendens]
MERDQKDNLEIGSIYAHSVNEPTSAISVTQGQEARTIEEKPIEFLREFDKICRVQKRPEGSSEEDLKLSEADAWFIGLEPNSIKTWLEFKMEFLNQFIPAAKTNALRREIREATQEYGKRLSKYWHSYQGYLDTCPNHNLMEVEIYSKFYDGMDAKSKDIVNSSSGGSFYKLRLSKAKIVLEKLLNAKREYDDTSVAPVQEKVKSTPTEDKGDLLKSWIDKLEETLQSVIESRYHPTVPIQTHFQTDQVNHPQEHRGGLKFEWKLEPWKSSRGVPTGIPTLWRMELGRRSSEPPLNENRHAESAGGMSEGWNASQQNMRSCTRSNDALVTEMQRTYDEQKSNMDDMIRQVAQLTEMMKELQENRARSEVNENKEKEEGVSEAEEEKPANAEEKLEALPERQRKVETIEIELAETETRTEKESITTPPDEEALHKTL